jgi:hypothetical protein
MISPYNVIVVFTQLTRSEISFSCRERMDRKRTRTQYEALLERTTQRLFARHQMSSQQSAPLEPTTDRASVNTPASSSSSHEAGLVSTPSFTKVSSADSVGRAKPNEEEGATRCVEDRLAAADDGAEESVSSEATVPLPREKNLRDETKLPWCSDVATILEPLLAGDLGSAVVSFRLRRSVTCHRHAAQMATLLAPPLRGSNSHYSAHSPLLPAATDDTLEVFVLVGNRSLYHAPCKSIPTLAFLAALMASPTVTKIVVNARFIYQLLLSHYGSACVAAKSVFDISVAAAYAFPGRILSMTDMLNEAVYAKGETNLRISPITSPEGILYGSVLEDLVAVREFYQNRLRTVVEAHAARLRAFDEDCKLEFVATKMAFEGLFFDAAGARSVRLQAESLISEVETLASQIAPGLLIGDPIAVASLVRGMELRPGESDEVGAAGETQSLSRSAAVEFLSNIIRGEEANPRRSDGPRLAMLFDARQRLLKYCSQLDKWTGQLSVPSPLNRTHLRRVHPTWTVHHSTTGRIFSSVCNVQTIGRKGVDVSSAVCYNTLAAAGERTGRASDDAQLPSLLRLFIAPPETTFVSFDYNQIELRLLAHFSRDAGLLEAFARRKDVFRMMAGTIFGKATPDDVTAEERNVTKTIVYGIVYGLGTAALQEQLAALPRSADTRAVWDAEDIIQTLFAVFPSLSRFLHETKWQAVRDGCYTTVSGHQKQYPDEHVTSLGAMQEDNSSSSRTAAAASRIRRIATSYLIQSSGAELLRHAVLDIDQRLVSSGACCIAMALHDEVVLVVRDDAVAAVVESIRSLTAHQREVFQLNVDVVVSVRCGKNLAELFPQTFAITEEA